MDEQTTPLHIARAQAELKKYIDELTANARAVGQAWARDAEFAELQALAKIHDDALDELGRSDALAFCFEGNALNLVLTAIYGDDRRDEQMLIQMTFGHAVDVPQVCELRGWLDAVHEVWAEVR